MLINEAGVVRAIKRAYKGGGYTVNVQGGIMSIYTQNWYWDCTRPDVVLTKTMYAGFPHLHFGGELPLAERFVERAVEWRDEHDR